MGVMKRASFAYRLSYQFSKVKNYYLVEKEE